MAFFVNRDSRNFLARTPMNFVGETKIKTASSSFFLEKLFPKWVILHIPHNSVVIPEAVRDQFLLTEDELRAELIRITDHCTQKLFVHGISPKQIVCAEVSRLVVDVERFENDAMEPMASKGMGCIYTLTSQGIPLRRMLESNERESLLNHYYRPHHIRLAMAVDHALKKNGKCLVLDCHSFPETPLPCELSPGTTRPDICIGTDDFHTPASLVQAFIQAFVNAGFSVQCDSPFRGALVPTKHHQRNARVQAVMIEVNRRLYCNEPTGLPLDNFSKIARQVSACCRTALNRQ